MGNESRLSGCSGEFKGGVDGSRCRFSVIDIGNSNAAVVYWQIWNLPSGSVTVGTTAPLWSIEVPASSGKVIAPGGLIDFGGSGFTIAVTTARANSTAPGAAVDINIAY